MSFRIPYLVGNTYRRDFQSFPTIPIANIIPDFPSQSITPLQVLQNWPASNVTMAQLLALARVKTWNLSGHINATGTVYIHGSGVNYNAVTTTCDFNNVYIKQIRCTDFVPAAKETDLLNCYTDFAAFPYFSSAALFKFLFGGSQVDLTSSSSLVVNFHYHSMPTGTDLYDTLSTSFLGVVNILAGFVPTVLFTALDNFSPVILLSSGTYISLGFNFGLGFITNGAPVTNITQFPGTLLLVSGVAPNITVPLQVTMLIPALVDDSVSSSGSVSCTLTATEFWPYTNSTGQPIYNLTTGAQLNDPFS